MIYCYPVITHAARHVARHVGHHLAHHHIAWSVTLVCISVGAGVGLLPARPGGAPVPIVSVSPPVVSTFVPGAFYYPPQNAEERLAATLPPERQVVTYAPSAPAPTPVDEPAGMLVLAVGLGGIAMLRRKRRSLCRGR
jgi:MYXO-CTERM domain-containing protein